ncbi:cytochrome P450 [Mycena pura]|uniref:Cytochrome P450 n=1 Tax=Mycena pura TaxID=153505 RepID=A0AAD6Y452_9AGAR|nr:cytochrome P450 [Mycena pura]
MISILVFAAVLAGLGLLAHFRRQRPIGHLAGPSSPSWIFGNLLQLADAPQHGDYEFAWRKRFGDVYRIKGCFGEDRLLVADPAALQFILNNPIFAFSPAYRTLMSWVFGPRSIGALQGAPHKELKSKMNIGFTAAAVRQYQSTFEHIARRASLSDRLENIDTPSTDLVPLLSDTTLNAITEVVFGCSTEQLDADFVRSSTQILVPPPNQYAAQSLFSAIASRFPTRVLQPAIHLPTGIFKTLRAQRRLAGREGWRLVNEKVEAIKHGMELDDLYSRFGHNGDRSRHFPDSLPIHRMQAITLCFGLIELAKNPQLQTDLRQEIHAARGMNHRTIAYESLALLNALIKETLRMYPPEPIADRVAGEDVDIPLSQPITSTTGDKVMHIPIRKGQILSVAIASYQRLESRWGEDAHKFRPSRWLDGTVHQGEAIGPYANLLSFLGGPRVCLGWRFAVTEMQVILCELVGKYSFSLPEDQRTRAKGGFMLLPVDSEGQTCARLRVRRVV